MNTLNKALSERLRYAILHTGVSMKEFGVRTGIPYRTLQNYLSGDRLPGAEALQSMSKNGLDVNWLLTGRRIETLEHIAEDKNVTFSYVVSKGSQKKWKDILDITSKCELFEYIAAQAFAEADETNTNKIKNGESIYSSMEMIAIIQVTVEKILNIINNMIEFLYQINNKEGDLETSVPFEGRLNVAVHFVNDALGGKISEKVRAFLCSQELVDMVERYKATKTSN